MKIRLPNFLKIRSKKDKKKPTRYKQIKKLIKKTKPLNILEIGAWRGERAIQMCQIAYKVNRRKGRDDTIYYLGFDLFEDGSEEIDRKELNVKQHNSMLDVQNHIDSYLDKIAKDKFVTNLVKGNTNETLKFLKNNYEFLFKDFAFIDGGHSINTIKNDGDATSYIKHRIFDDYYVANRQGKGPDISKYGCNQYIKSLDKKIFYIKILSEADPVKDGGFTKMVYVKRKK